MSACGNDQSYEEINLSRVELICCFFFNYPAPSADVGFLSLTNSWLPDRRPFLIVVYESHYYGYVLNHTRLSESYCVLETISKYMYLPH